MVTLPFGQAHTSFLIFPKDQPRAPQDLIVWVGRGGRLPVQERWRHLREAQVLVSSSPTQTASVITFLLRPQSAKTAQLQEMVPRGFELTHCPDKPLAKKRLVLWLRALTAAWPSPKGF